jgi:hypothetical protein
MKVKDIMVRDIATLDVEDELSLANDIMNGPNQVYQSGR